MPNGEALPADWGGWSWSSEEGYAYGGVSVPEGPTTTPGVAYDPATDPSLISVGLAPTIEAPPEAPVPAIPEPPIPKVPSPAPPLPTVEGFTGEEQAVAGLTEPVQEWEIRGYQPWYYETPGGRQDILADIAAARASAAAMEAMSPAERAEFEAAEVPEGYEEPRIYPPGEEPVFRPGVPYVSPEVRAAIRAGTYVSPERRKILESLEEAKRRREEESAAGITVHGIEYHLKQQSIEKEQIAGGGVPYAQMTPTQQEVYTKQIQMGLGIQEAARVAVTPILPTIIVEGKEVYDIAKIYRSGELQLAFRDKVPEGAEILNEYGARLELQKLPTVDGQYDIEKIYADPNLRRTFEEEVPGGAEFLKTEIKRRKGLEEQEKYKDWSAEELLGGKVSPEGVYVPSPWRVKRGLYIPLPDWGKRKVYEAQLAAIESLDPYKIETETGKYYVKGTPKYPLGERFPEIVTTYDIPAALAKVSESTLRLAGFSDRDITEAKVVAKQQAEADVLRIKYENLESRLQPYTTLQPSPLEAPGRQLQEVIDIGEALDKEVVSVAELKELGYTQANIDRAKVYHKEGWKVWIPVYGTIATWSVATPLERGIAVAGDVLLIVPTVGWLGKTGSIALKASTRALAVGIAPKVGVIARLGTAAKAGLFAAERLAVAPVTFPIQVIRAPKVALKGLWEITKFPFAHPLETTKGINAIVTGKAFLGEPTTVQLAKLVFGKAIPGAAVAIPTLGTGVQRVFVSHGLTDAEALEATRLMQIRLSDMIVQGVKIPKTIEIPVYEGGKLKLTIKYPTTRAMRELGFATTATPFAERVFTGAAEPVGKNKVYFSTAMSPEWTGVTARGYTTPEAVEMGRGGAIMKDMRINRFFDPVAKVYRHSVEVEMTVPLGTQMVTGRETVLDVLKTQGNVRVFPSVVMERTSPRDIIAAARASEGKQFEYRPIDFTEVQSLPKGSANEIEVYVRTNDMMVGGSAAERTWTRTIKLPEDIDLISLRNNAKLDAERLAVIIERTSGIKTRVSDGRTFKVPKDVWRIEKFVDGKWEQVTDVLDYRVHMTYNPDILNREPVTVEGIKVEHPLEQVERIAAKVEEYPPPTLEQHRGHPKRLAWMAEMILDTPGGKLTDTQIKTLNNIGARIDFTIATPEQLRRLKIGGVLDAVRDFFSPRRIEIRLPDGRKVSTPRGAEAELRSFIENRPNATDKEIHDVIRGINDRLIYDEVAEAVRGGKARSAIEDIVLRDPSMRDVPRETLSRFVDELEANILYDMRAAGKFTVGEVRAMIYSGITTSGTARALTELTRLLGEVTRAVVPPREIPAEVERFIPRRVIPERLIAPRDVTPLVTELRVPTEEERIVKEERAITEEKRIIAEERIIPEEERVPRERITPEEEHIVEERIPIEEERLELGRLERERLERERFERERFDLERFERERFEGERVILPSGALEEGERPRIPLGSIAWRQGMLKVRGELKPVWKYLTYPWDMSKPITLLAPPIGAKNVHLRTPQETIQQIGEGPVPSDISIDLGVADIYISGGGKRIRYEGKGLETDVGKRIIGPTHGLSIPEEVVPKRMREYEERELGVEEERMPIRRKNGRLIREDAIPEMLEIFR